MSTLKQLDSDIMSIGHDDIIAAGTRGQTWIIYSDTKQPDYVAKGVSLFSDHQAVHALEKTYHPSLPRCFGKCFVPVVQQECYLFEYVEGVSLRNYDFNNSEEIIKLFASLFELLNFMQMMLDNPLMHLDIKPDNIIIKSNGIPVLIDFDSACCDQSCVRSCTHDYAAPEHRAGKPTPASDVFSLSLVLVELLIDMRPENILGEALNSIELPLSRQSANLIKRGLASDSQYRPNADELAAALKYSVDQFNSLENSDEEGTDFVDDNQLICVWQSAELACELASFISSRQPNVLMIDANWLDPRADLLLGLAEISKKHMSSTLTRYLDHALVCAADNALDSKKLMSLVRQTAIPGLWVLSPSGRYDFYEKDMVEAFSRLLVLARQCFNRIVIAAGSIVYDDLTCLALATSDAVLTGVSANTADMRSVGRLVAFARINNLADISKFWFVAHDYQKKCDLSISLLREICQEKILRPVTFCKRRRKSRGSSHPYALNLTRANRSEYAAICRKTGIL
jgi:serine/threonine protein kinase